MTRKEAEEYVRWLESCKTWTNSKAATVRVGPTVINKVIEIIRYLLGPDSKIKPCPFCGGTPDIIFCHGGGPNKRLVFCVNDDCKVRPEVVGSTRARALKAWNTRR